MGKRCVRIMLLAAFLLVSAVFAGAQTASPPLLIIADLDYSGISDAQMKLLVDLFSYTAFETGEFIVLNRYERNKLLKGFGYNQNRLTEKAAYLEAGELLRAEYLVTGICVFEPGALELALSLWEVNQGGLVASLNREYPSLDELVDQSRAVIAELVAPLGRGAVTGGSGSESGLSETLYVTRIKERVLVVFPFKTKTNEEAGFHVLVNEACAFLYADERRIVQFSSLAYDMDAPDVAAGIEILKDRDCHTLALLSREQGAYALVFYAEDGTQVFRLPCHPERDRKQEAKRIAAALDQGLPPLSLTMIARELSREAVIKEKLDLLLFNERFLSQQFFINVHLGVLKPAVVGKYHPLLNILSLEGDCYWYYAGLLGCGAGYAVSLGYPATIDTKLVSHPLVLQHEFRLIPLSFRSAGPVSVLINLIASFNAHNAYRITYNSVIDKYDFLDEILLCFFKFSLNTGLLVNFSDDMSVFIDLATISYIVPLDIGSITYDGTRISGALGGVGAVFRF